MSSVIQATAADLRTGSAFETLMWALARPGSRQKLSEPGVLALAESLLDRETSFHAVDEALAAALSRSGARKLPLHEADFIFAPLGDPAQTAAVTTASVGDPLYPDTGATIFAPAGFDTGAMLELSGPGIDGVVRLKVAGVDPGFWRARDAAAFYPLGWDVFLVSDHEVVGIPRSTKVKVI